MPLPMLSASRMEVNASGVMTPQSLDGLQGLVELTMAEHGPEARMCLKAGDLLGLLKTRYVRGTGYGSGPAPKGITVSGNPDYTYTTGVMNRGMANQETNSREGLQRDLVATRAAKDGAYRKRNHVLALLAHVAHDYGWRVGVGQHPESDITWEMDWRTILFIDLPTGQASWHFHDSEAHLLEGLPMYPGAWDGHTTEEKYQRVEAQVRAMGKAGTEPMGRLITD